jgi:hypothetical protein
VRSGLKNALKLFKTSKSRDRKKSPEEAGKIIGNSPDIGLCSPEIWASIIMWVVQQIDFEVFKDALFGIDLQDSRYM